MNKDVSVRTLESFDIKEAENVVRECFADIGIEKLIRPKMKVLLKVCLPEAKNPNLALTTHPTIVRALINMLVELDVRVIVADSPYGKYNETNLEKVYLDTGMVEVANNTKCELNMNLATTTISNPDGVRSKSIEMLDVINKVDAIINVGKIRLDNKLGYMGVSANIFGLIPGEVKTQIIRRTDKLSDYYNYIIDILNALQDKLVLNVLDAVVAVEKNDTQRMLSCLGMSANPYALDSAFIKIIGMDYNNTIIKQASNRGLIDINNPYKMVGEKIDNFIVDDFSIPEFSEELNFRNGIRQKTYFKKNIEHITINPKQCKGCSVCSKICPANAITMRYDKNGELYAEVDYAKCIYCKKCVVACPYSVVKVKTPSGHKKIRKQINKYNNN